MVVKFSISSIRKLGYRRVLTFVIELHWDFILHLELIGYGLQLLLRKEVPVGNELHLQLFFFLHNIKSASHSYLSLGDDCGVDELQLNLHLFLSEASDDP